MPEVTIGLPVYNGEEHLRRTLDMLLSQDYGDIELILADNASSDGTEEICRSFAARDKRIRYVRHKRNMGMAYNWQFVYEQAAGKYFMWAAHDDEYSLNFVSALVRALEDEPEAVVAYSRNYFVDGQGNVVIDCNRLGDLAGPVPLVQRLHNVLWFEEGAQKANVTSGLIRLDTMRQLGVPDYTADWYGTFGGDQLLVFQLAFSGYFTYVPEAQFYKRYHPGRTYDADDLLDNFCEMQTYFANHRWFIRDSDRLDDLSKQMLLSSLSARETVWYFRVLSTKNMNEFQSRMGTVMEFCDQRQEQAAASASAGSEPFNSVARHGVKPVPWSASASDGLARSDNRDRTSIVILNYNGLQQIKECLESIDRHTPEPHEVIVFDNASTDGSRDYLRTLRNIMLAESPVNLGCPAGRAQAFALATGDFVVLLDNDTVVTPGWLTRFLRHMRENPDVGLIGPRSNFVSGSQKVQGANYQNRFEMTQFAKLWSWLASRQPALVPTYRLVGFCMFIRRAVIEKIGGLDPVFGMFGCEDDDFTLRAIVAGFKTMIANDVFIHHTGGPQKTGNVEYNRGLRRAWDRFVIKWELQKDLECGKPYDVQRACSQPFDPQKHFIPIPDIETVRPLVYMPNHHRVDSAERPVPGSRHQISGVREGTSDRV